MSDQYLLMQHYLTSLLFIETEYLIHTSIFCLINFIKIFILFVLYTFQDISKLTALSPEVISRQATINIGTIGHVAHGKSTVVKAISGVHTVRFKNELERNITIKLGKQFCFLVF